VLLADGGGAPTRLPTRRGARLLLVLPRDADYTLRAEAPATASGHFDLEFRQGRQAAAAPSTELRRGIAESGTFTFVSEAEVQSPSQIRYFYRDFSLPVRAGEVLTLDLESPNFDPMLEVGVTSPIGFAVADQDDDSGEGLNARLVLRPQSRGTLVVRARTRRAEVGCFNLRVTETELRPAARGPATPPPAAIGPQACAAAETGTRPAPARPES
jgi:hypothetical protein